MSRSAPALRPYLPDDAPLLAAIFAASIMDLTGDDYSEAQQEAWAAAADDEQAFGKKLAGQLTLIATLQGAPVGFASLKGTDYVDMLYVHPSAVGQLEKIASARGTKTLKVDASDTALEFFRKRGYVAQQRNSVTIGDEWLANTTMQKTLDGVAAPGGHA